MAFFKSFLQPVLCVIFVLGQFSSVHVESTDTSQPLDFHLFEDAVNFPFAVCNDGSRGGYFYSAAIDPSQSTVFVIHLPGGGQCYDKTSCDERDMSMKSSTGYNSTLNVTGFLDSSPAKTPLWGANKAYLGYCSSDAYMGDAEASDATWGYHFRGQRLVYTLIQYLFDKHDLGSATTIYLTGTSAGARGLMTLVDKLVATVLPASAKVIALLDSPYYLDVVPYSNSESKGFQYQEQQKYLYFNTAGVISAECGAVYPANSGEQWKCQFGEYRMPFVRTPYFLVASQYDKYQLQELTGLQGAEDYSTDASAVAYAEAFGQQDRHGMRNLSMSIIDAAQSAAATAAAVSSPGVAAAAAGEVTSLPSEQNKLRYRKGQAASSSPQHQRVSETTSSETPGPGHSPIPLNNRGDSGLVSGDGGVPAVNNNSNIVSTGFAGGYGFFYWACYNHAVGLKDLFYLAATNKGVTLKQAFEEYLSRQPAAPVPVSAPVTGTAKVPSAKTGDAHGAGAVAAGAPESSSRRSSLISAAAWGGSSPTNDARASSSAGSNSGDPKNTGNIVFAGSSWVMTWMDCCQSFNCGLHCEG